MTLFKQVQSQSSSSHQFTVFPWAFAFYLLIILLGFGVNGRKDRERIEKKVDAIVNHLHIEVSDD